MENKTVVIQRSVCTFSGTQGGYRKWWNNKVIGENEQ